MSLVKLFKSDVENVGKENPLALSLMQTEMNVFMLQLDIDVRKVNGPYVSYFPEDRDGSPQRVVYTANITYHKK